MTNYSLGAKFKLSSFFFNHTVQDSVTFEMPQLSGLQKFVRLWDDVSIRAIATEINVDNV
jgi:hypothetical protein